MRTHTDTPAQVNDFAIVAATANGSGSQTANNTIIRAIFTMGIPVNGKNLFPSNIQGEPTWFTIRVSRDGYTSRPAHVPILVAFNPRTAAEDLAALPAGGICLYPGDGPWRPERPDVTSYPLPVKALVAESGFEPRMRDYAANMVYVGALAALIGIDLAEIRAALEHHFGKPKPVELNDGVVRAAHAWMAERLGCQPACPYRLERMGATAGQILIDGNSAAAMGAVFGGVSFIGWYPITPATSLADGLAYYLPRLRTNPDGTASYAIVQAEDEIAALGMLIGAGWAGARAMTSTSGPGISLMSEFAGLGYFAEIPCVVWDVQRVGPSTGMPTRTSQGDLISTYFLGHGDTRQVVLLPGSVAECFEFGWRAFDVAEELQTPVFVLSDLDLGMNMWMSPAFSYPDGPMRRGKVLSADDLSRLGRFVRFEDPEGDGVGARTLPGNPHPLAAQLSRGTGHNERNVYSERPADWVANMDRLGRKHETARKLVPQPVIDRRDGAELGIIGMGSSEAAIGEARDLLRAQGVETSFMRVRALPLGEPARAFVEDHARVIVVELNHDGQLRQLLQLHCPAHAARIQSVAFNDGLPLTAPFVSEKILEAL
ncbi:2-oxoacid:acceptor oxidoreductase subunit alpha [Oscillochloris sp. ZM17-4]|uniref:2-oxoacid:acceptor oxidoreductase subunit alpha n=1 Tax=Oscillochloris sp. ZM17-4 TaxID=2866714 RepID=UPI001C732E8B|nr:2-oxoacid:acceptor oxidoreductase subunit alpha [Oscillochloris sp. ZM17-4]MBX0327272.1 2-oxoacid:acceptor oxidoreductase subunit alpha [Oscillochloris sp. ZM17-4]